MDVNSAKKLKQQRKMRTENNMNMTYEDGTNEKIRNITEA